MTRKASIFKILSNELIEWIQSLLESSPVEAARQKNGRMSEAI